VDHGVERDLADPLLELGLGGQLAEQNEVGYIEVGAFFRQLLDGVATVAQDALVAIDEGDRASARGGVHEGGIVGHEPEVLGPGLDLSQVHGPNGPVVNGDLIGGLGALVDNG